MQFKLHSPYQPAGDQPRAIQQLVHHFQEGETYQVLLGVTGSGKTFTMANVISQLNRPTLILSHNKTLAAQLYGEFKGFFPENAVEYFISYYDYYQPEAYIPTSGLYIEKDLSINQEIEKLRLSTTSALASGRRDVVVVASVSCIYGMGNPEEFAKSIVRVSKGQQIARNKLLFSLVEILYSRTTADFRRGTFRAKGDTVDVWPAYADFAYRIYFWGDEVERISRIDAESGTTLSEEFQITLYAANLFVTGRETLNAAIHKIQADLVEQIKFFEREGRFQEAQRIKERTEFDLEMMRELGYCSGIENYSRYFDGRVPGARPFCLLDYFPEDFLLIVDESHVTMPQIRAMYGGDRSRKVNLVDYGFRLPSAMDNRPLKSDEFQEIVNDILFVSATPADFELSLTEGAVVEQIVRPTGLLDPIIEVRPTLNQIDDLLEEIRKRVERDERVLITALTKRMAEELSRFMDQRGIRARYIHSEVKTLDRVEILRELRLGIFDVLIGVNLLREGLDLPEVSLVCIMDADKEGFLRDNRSMIQTIGRAARNENGMVIMYADNMTDSMEKAISETKRRRAAQEAHNLKHGITPTTVKKDKATIMGTTAVADAKQTTKVYDLDDVAPNLAAEPVVAYMSLPQLEKLATQTQRNMEKAAKDLDFMQAAALRDELMQIKKLIESKKR